MVHPAVYAAIAVGGVVIIGLKLYEEYLENKSYEQFQRNRTRYEQEYNRYHRGNNDFDFDDDRDYGNQEEEDNDPYTIRKRRPYANSPSSSGHNLKRSVHEDEQDQYELSELESSIAERKRRLMAEQAFLDQEEENLRNRKNGLMRNYSEIDDVTSDHIATTQIKIHDHSSSSNSTSDNEDDEDDEHSLKSHMAHFDPFADQFQEASNGTETEYNSLENSDSTERMVIVANNNQEQQQGNINSNSSSTELRYPSPRMTTPTTSNTNSTTDGSPVISPQIMSVSSTRGSDSEESWDAVSEIEWNQSSAYESDNDNHSHHSLGFSDDDHRISY